MHKKIICDFKLLLFSCKISKSGVPQFSDFTDDTQQRVTGPLNCRIYKKNHNKIVFQLKIVIY